MGLFIMDADGEPTTPPPSAKHTLKINELISVVTFKNLSGDLVNSEEKVNVDANLVARRVCADCIDCFDKLLSMRSMGKINEKPT